MKTLESVCINFVNHLSLNFIGIKNDINPFSKVKDQVFSHIEYSIYREIKDKVYEKLSRN